MKLKIIQQSSLEGLHSLPDSGLSTGDFSSFGNSNTTGRRLFSFSQPETPCYKYHPYVKPTDIKKKAPQLLIVSSLYGEMDYLFKRFRKLMDLKLIPEDNLLATYEDTFRKSLSIYNSGEMIMPKNPKSILKKPQAFSSTLSPTHKMNNRRVRFLDDEGQLFKRNNYKASAIELGFDGSQQFM